MIPNRGTFILRSIRLSISAFFFGKSQDGRTEARLIIFYGYFSYVAICDFLWQNALNDMYELT